MIFYKLCLFPLFPLILVFKLKLYLLVFNVQSLINQCPGDMSSHVIFDNKIAIYT